MNALSLLALLAPLTGGNPPTPANCAPCAAPRLQMPYPAGPDINANRPCPPVGPPAEVLAAKFVLPAGVRLTAFPGSALAKTFAGSTLFALRPGYAYRFELAGFAKSDAVLYPEVEVRGTLMLRASMSLMEHFAAINFSERDLERAAAGALITKVVYLEDPEKAVAVKTSAEKPLEIPDDSEEDAIKAAYENGRIVMIVRLGNRKPTVEELAKVAIPGTILMPGENHLAAPTIPPTLGWQGVPLFDPILGPKFPSEECLTDGGDKGPGLGVHDDGRLGGLMPTDTSAEFTVGDKKKVTTSNTVCICAPRFVVRRVEQGAIGFANIVRPQAGIERISSAVLRVNQPPMVLASREKPAGILEMIHPQIQRGTQRTSVASSREGARAIYKVDSAKIMTGASEPEEVQNSDEFLLTKEVTPKEHVKVGDEVTFTLRYTNRTNKAGDGRGGERQSQRPPGVHPRHRRERPPDERDHDRERRRLSDCQIRVARHVAAGPGGRHQVQGESAVIRHATTGVC